jgi:hypothetical protein
MRPHRLLAPFVALVLLGTGCSGDADPAPAPRPPGPEAFVAVRDGALVRFELAGRTAGPVTELLSDAESQWYVPFDGRDGHVTVTRFTEGGMESITHSVGVIDAGSGQVTGLGPDGPAAGLLLSPDGRYRYELISPDSGIVTSIDRVDAANGSRRTIVPDERPESGDTIGSAALSPDGRTLYIVATYDEAPWRLRAVDTGTGRTRTIETGLDDDLYHVVASPDGRTLALTVDAGGADGDRKTRVALLPLDGGGLRWVKAPNAAATAFTRAGDVLLIVDSGDERTALALGDVATGDVRGITGADDVGHAVSAD